MNIRRSAACLVTAVAISLGIPVHGLAVTQTTPPYGAAVTGPGCTQVSGYVTAGSDGFWARSGYGGFRGGFGNGSCNGSQYYTRTCDSAVQCASGGAHVRWHFMDNGYGDTTAKYHLTISVYIPTAYANDEGTPYRISFYRHSQIGGPAEVQITTLFINQATKSGWYRIYDNTYNFQMGGWDQIQLEMGSNGPNLNEFAGASAAAFTATNVGF